MINVYLTKSNSLAGKSTSDLDGLSDFGQAELDRLRSIASDTRRSESASALEALRKLLLICGHTPHCIARTDNGKPYFEGEFSLPFSISHSGGICAAAIGSLDDGDIGIDLEILRPVRDAQGIAKRFFDKNELEAFYKSEQTDFDFLKLWTQKEARAKTSGIGLFERAQADDTPLFLHTQTVFVDECEAVLSVCSKKQVDGIIIHK